MQTIKKMVTLDLEVKQVRSLIRLVKRDVKDLQNRDKKSTFVPEEGKRDMNKQKIIWGEELLEMLRDSLPKEDEEVRRGSQTSSTGSPNAYSPEDEEALRKAIGK